MINYIFAYAFIAFALVLAICVYDVSISIRNFLLARKSRRMKKDIKKMRLDV